MPGRLRRCGSRRAELGILVGAPANGLADVETQLAGGPHGLMISSARSGSAIRPCTTVARSWLKKSPLRLPSTFMLAFSTCLCRFPVRGERHAVDIGVALGVPDVVQMRDRFDEGAVEAGGVAERRAVERRAQAEVRGVGAGQEGGERRLGAPGGGEGPHGQATHEPDQHDEGQIGATAVLEGGAEAVSRDPERAAGHGPAPPSRWSVAVIASLSPASWVQSARGPEGRQGG